MTVKLVINGKGGFLARYCPLSVEIGTASSVTPVTFKVKSLTLEDAEVKGASPPTITEETFSSFHRRAEQLWPRCERLLPSLKASGEHVLVFFPRSTVALQRNAAKKKAAGVCCLVPAVTFPKAAEV